MNPKPDDIAAVKKRLREDLSQGKRLQPIPIAIAGMLLDSHDKLEAENARLTKLLAGDMRKDELTKACIDYEAENARLRERLEAAEKLLLITDGNLSGTSTKESPNDYITDPIDKFLGLGKYANPPLLDGVGNGHGGFAGAILPGALDGFGFLPVALAGGLAVHRHPIASFAVELLARAVDQAVAALVVCGLWATLGAALGGVAAVKTDH